MSAALAEYLIAASRRLWVGNLTDAERLECIRRALAAIAKASAAVLLLTLAGCATVTSAPAPLLPLYERALERARRVCLADGDIWNETASKCIANMRRRGIERSA